MPTYCEETIRIVQSLTNDSLIKVVTLLYSIGSIKFIRILSEFL